MNKLVKGVLTIGTLLTPNNRASCVGHRFPLPGDALAIAFHFSLLQICRQVFQVLVIRQDGLGVGAEEVVVPNAQNCHHDWNVALKGGVAEVLVCQISAAQEGFEIIHSNRNCHRKTNCRPNREAPADPIPKLKHIFGVDAETCNLGGVGGDSDEMLGNIALRAGTLQKPSAGRARIAHSLLRGEGFRGNQEKRRFRVKLLECLDDIGAIHIGDKVHTQAGVGIRLQSSTNHLRA